MNLTKSNGSPHFGNIAKLSGVNKHTIRSAGMRGIDVTDIAALRAFRDSKNQRSSDTNRKRCAIVRENDPLNQKIRELRLRNYGYKTIGRELGISKGAVHSRCERMGLNGRMGSQKRFNPNGMVMEEYEQEKRVMGKMDWRNHPSLTNEYARLYYHKTKTPDKIAQNRDKAAKRWVRLKNDPEHKRKKAIQIKAWKKRNKDKVNANQKQWAKKNPERVTAFRRKSRKKRMLDPINRIIHNMRKRVSKALKTSSDSTVDLIGCSSNQLRAHIQAQFIGCMSWDNYGTAWHIDHIVPCSYFEPSRKEERMRCNHFSNLRPLWAKTNIKRSNNAGWQTIPMGI